MVASLRDHRSSFKAAILHRLQITPIPQHPTNVQKALSRQAIDHRRHNALFVFEPLFKFSIVSQKYDDTKWGAYKALSSPSHFL